MGSIASRPEWVGSAKETDGDEAKLGDVLSGRFDDVDVDSVAGVRDQRE